MGKLHKSRNTPDVYGGCREKHCIVVMVVFVVVVAAAAAVIPPKPITFSDCPDCWVIVTVGLDSQLWVLPSPSEMNADPSKGWLIFLFVSVSETDHCADSL